MKEVNLNISVAVDGNDKHWQKHLAESLRALAVSVKKASPTIVHGQIMPMVLNGDGVNYTFNLNLNGQLGGPQ
jgi:hypothetical protein